MNVEVQIALVILIVWIVGVGLAFGISAIIRYFYWKSIPKHEWSSIVPVKAVFVNLKYDDGTSVTTTVQGRFCLKCGKQIEANLVDSPSADHYLRKMYRCIKEKK
jgi:hypothetical protein